MYLVFRIEDVYSARKVKLAPCKQNDSQLKLGLKIGSPNNMIIYQVYVLVEICLTMDQLLHQLLHAGIEAKSVGALPT
jgi:uncharacterized protein YjaG (DUF416 family)